MITATPKIIDVINKARMEITMSVEITDGDDTRTVTGTGKAKTKDELERLSRAIVAKYQQQLVKEALLVTVKKEMEITATKTYLEEQLNA